MGNQSAITKIRPKPETAHGRTAGSAKKNKAKDKKYLAYAFMVGAVVLLFLAWHSGSSTNRKGDPTISRRDLRVIENVVNKHLKMTNQRIEIDQERARLEYDKDPPSVGDQILPRHNNQIRGVDLRPDRDELNANRDLHKAEDLNLVSPDSVIQSEIADSLSHNQYEEKYRAEYARRYIENARNAGYDIELDDNYVVRSVKKIGSGEETLFSNGAAGGPLGHDHRANSQ